MKKPIIASLAFLLAACQTTQAGIDVRTVEVPVPVPCLTSEQLADIQEPAQIGNQLGRTPETAIEDRNILAASNLRLRAWGLTLYSALEACAE